MNSKHKMGSFLKASLQLASLGITGPWGIAVAYLVKSGAVDDGVDKLIDLTVKGVEFLQRHNDHDMDETQTKRIVRNLTTAKAQVDTKRKVPK